MHLTILHFFNLGLLVLLVPLAVGRQVAVLVKLSSVLHLRRLFIDALQLPYDLLASIVVLIKVLLILLYRIGMERALTRRLGLLLFDANKLT